MIPWYYGLALGLLGLTLGTLLMAIPHWLNVREEGYQTGYSDGLRHGAEAERSGSGLRSRKLPPLSESKEYR